MTVQLHVGYIGKTLTGDRVEIVSARDSFQYPWRGSNGWFYTADGLGCIGGKTDADIMGPWEEPAAKVGEYTIDPTGKTIWFDPIDGLLHVREHEEPVVETVKRSLHGSKFIGYVAVDKIDGEYDLSTVRKWEGE